MKTLIFNILLIAFSANSFAQNEKPASEKKLHFGFNFGVNYSNVLKDWDYVNGYSIENGPGVQLGLIANYSALKFLSISPKAELSFNQNSIRFTNTDIENFEVLPVSLQFMTHFQFKLNRFSWKPYFFAGPNLKIPMNNSTDLSNVFPSRNDLAIDFGIGLDKHMSFFTFAPELRYSYGLLNISNHPATGPMHFHSMALVLNFL